MLVEFIRHYFITIKIKMHINTLTFTNPRIINAVSYLAFMIFQCLRQRIEFFNENHSLRLTNFTHFPRTSNFPRGKGNVDTFSLLLLYPLEQPNATYL